MYDLYLFYSYPTSVLVINTRQDKTECVITVDH